MLNENAVWFALEGEVFMDTLPRILVKVFTFLCAVFAVFAILIGNVTSAPDSGFGKLSQGENLNDVYCIIRNQNGEIYTLGQTCVQKFDKSGNFVGGAYYDANTMKQANNRKFLTLNAGEVVVFNRTENVVYCFDESFNLVETIQTKPNYSENEFYRDYPNTDASAEVVRLSFWSNAVQTIDGKIRLDAPRNRLFSREVGFIILLAAVLLLAGRAIFGMQDEK